MREIDEDERREAMEQRLRQRRGHVVSRTYDDWKCTDPNDRFLGPRPLAECWRDFEDGEISLDDMGEALLADGETPKAVRKILSIHTQYPIPTGYFGEE